MLIILLSFTFVSCDTRTTTDLNGNEENNITTEDYLFEMDKSPDDGFYWEYYLYIPEGVNLNEPTRLLVEAPSPKNSDDRSDHKAEAEVTARYNLYAHSLDIPVLVPAFANFENPPSEYDYPGDHMVLCEKTLTESYEEVKRLDKQVLEMIDDAQAFLNNHSDSNLSNLEFEERLFLTGGSGTGTFANRFTKLHPERVRALVTGAQDHIILPFDRLHGENFDYPAGINDFEDYTGEEFDIESYREVAKFYTAGALEGTLNEFSGSIREPAQREAIRNAFGTGLETRWDNVKEEYENHDIPVQMVIYNATSHEIRSEMIEDKVAFFRANMGEEPVMDIDTHQYAEDDFKEDFDRFEKVNIKDIHWSQDPELPQEHQEFWEYDGGEEHQIILVTEEGFSSETQFVDFIFRTGFSIKLTSEDPNVDDIKLTKTDLDQGIYRVIDMINGVEKFYGISISLLYNEAHYNHSARYEFEMDSEVEEYFEVPDDLYLEPIE